MTKPLFDLQRFLQSLAEDEELARELLTAFLEDSPERSTSLCTALDAGDVGEVLKFAHSLKGMCGVVRAEALVDLAYLMENAAKDKNLAKASELYKIFTETLQAAHGEMRQFMNSA
jgi:HPt (histidine-containing phosphotransfer) domain-containing protein